MYLAQIKQISCLQNAISKNERERETSKRQVERKRNESESEEKKREGDISREVGHCFPGEAFSLSLSL